MVDSRIDDLKDRFPWVDLFFRPQQWDVFSKWAEEPRSAGLDGGRAASVPQNPPVSAYVPIMHGCDSFCSYCVVPYRRGRARSRDLDEVRCQVQNLVQRGTREVVLLGQIVDAYGDDLPSKPDLADLLAELNRIEGLCRIRFLTSHPSYMSRKLIGAIADLDKVCEHISLPIQAGDNDILKAMKRGYTVEEYGEPGRRTYAARIPDVALSTDVIVGFPGETDEQFAGTLEVLRQTRFDKVHIAAYSPRPETIATRQMPDDITSADKGGPPRPGGSPAERDSRRDQRGLPGPHGAGPGGGAEEGEVVGTHGGDKLVFFPAAGGLTGQLAKCQDRQDESPSRYRGPWRSG